MVMDKTMIVAGIGSRKGVTADEVIDAIDHALRVHGLSRSAIAALATTEFKRGEAGIFEAAQRLGVLVTVVDGATSAPACPLWGGIEGGGDPQTKVPAEIPSPLTPPHEGEGVLGPAALTHSNLSQALAGTPSVSETAALAAAGSGARLAGPRLAVGRVTCAIAFRDNTP
jgi:cobalt-precorrin 5A hydrolase